MVLLAVLPCRPLHGEGDTGAESDQQKVELAKSHFQKGVAFFDEENYEAALVEFLESYDLLPKWEFKFNIATCYARTHKYSKGLKVFREYLKEGGGGLPKERRDKVLASIAELEGKVGKVLLCCGLEGAALVIDNVEVLEKIPEEGMEIDPGFHRLEIEKEGFKPFVKEVKVVAGGVEKIGVDLVPLEVSKGREGKSVSKKTAASSKPEKKVVPGSSKKAKLKHPYEWLVGGLVAGGVVAAGAAVSGGMVIASRNDMLDAVDACASTAAREDCPDAYMHSDRARQWKLSANILTAAAAAAAIVGVTVFLVKWKKGRKEKQAGEKMSAQFFAGSGEGFGAGLGVSF